MEKMVGISDAGKHKSKSYFSLFRRDVYNDRYLYFLLLPAMLFVLVFSYAPMGGLVIAFQKFNIFAGKGSVILSIMKSPWVGFDNFRKVFNNPDFWMIMRNTILISVYKLFWGFPIPILLALLLNELRGKLFKRTVQTFLYLPHFISWVVIAGIMLAIFSPRTGVISEYFRFFNITPVNILAQQKSFRSILVLSQIWKESGWGTIIYLASFSLVDPQLYEAATMDGAGRLRKTLHVTLPAISGVIVLMLILNIGWLMNAGFDQIQALQNQVVQNVSDIFDTYVMRVGLQRGEYSMTSAVGLFKSVVSMILVFGADRVAKLIGEEGLF